MAELNYSLFNIAMYTAVLSITQKNPHFFARIDNTLVNTTNLDGAVEVIFCASLNQECIYSRYSL